MSQPRNLLLAYADNSAPTRLAITQFCENVARRTDNLLTISAVPDKQLGQPMKLLDTVMEGKVDMLIQPVDRWGSTLPKFGCVPAPFAFDDHAHADRVFGDDFDNWIAPDLETMGLVHLASWEWGFRQLTNSRRPVLSPEDMRGLKIRVPPSSIYRPTISAFGGIPIVVEYDKLSSVIKQNLVDGQENPFVVFYSLELQNSQKYISLINYSYGTLGHLINKSCFDRLRPEQQSILREESRKSRQLMVRLLRTHEAERLIDLACQGIQIDLPDLTAFKALTQPAYDALEASFGSNNLGSFLAMLQRQRLAAARKGRT